MRIVITRSLRPINQPWVAFLIILTVQHGTSPAVWAGNEEGKAAALRGDYATAYREWRPLAEQGDAKAQTNLGLLYKEGYGVPRDDNEAVTWFRKAALQGFPQAQTTLGLMYRQGRGVPQDLSEAVKLFRQAADQGFAIAQYNLGLSHEQGKGIAQDDVQAAIWYRKAADQGYAPAQHNLASQYLQGRGVAQDDAAALKWYRKAADQGFALAQGGMGYMYEQGRGGVTKDYEQAAKWYRQAAEKNVANAQSHLGLLYERGEGVGQDYAEAAKWYRKAADQGERVAQYQLGALYATGRGVAKDEVEAARLYTKAAEGGVALAQYDLGVLYAEGHGVSRDDAKALMWFRKAADSGLALAQHNLGVLYAEGRGVLHNDTEAAAWYRKAAEQDNADAANNLGLMYHDGRGVAKNETEARKWFNKAAEQGNTLAQTNLVLLDKRDQAIRGRRLFNGKGMCLTCHGRDADYSHVSDFYKSLNPKPTDLRNVRALKFRTEVERLSVLKNGVPGSSMISASNLFSEQEMSAVVDYLLYVAGGKAEIGYSDQLIHQVSGKGPHKTRPFTVKGDWRIDYEYRGKRFQIFRHSQDGAQAEEVRSIHNTMAADKPNDPLFTGTIPFSNDAAKTYYLRIETPGVWSLKVIQMIDTTAADAAPSAQGVDRGSEAVKELRKAAEQGDANAQRRLALRNPIPSTPENLERGKVLYEWKGTCHNCHGKKGDGHGPLEAVLSPKETNLTDCSFHLKREDDQLYWVIKTWHKGTRKPIVLMGSHDPTPGAQEVSPRPDLTDEEVWNMVNYIRTFCKK